MSVQMHRVRHRRLIDEEKLDPLALRNWQRRRLLGPGDVVERPDIAGHVAGEVERVPAIGLARLERRYRPQPAFEIKRERRRSHGGRVGDAHDRRVAGPQDDARLFVLALEDGQYW